MDENLPYSTSVGTLEKMLEKIKAASVPERFTQDFVNTKLVLKGGTANSCIPFIKKLGLVGTDGIPTDLYREFRNPKKSRMALGKGFRKAYARLYEMNEYVHDTDDASLLGLIVECTGGEKDSAPTKYTLTTINMLRKHADFEETDDEEPSLVDEPENSSKEINKISVSNPNNPSSNPNASRGINLSYTINLNLPATKDIEVFNAIFKSLKQHLLDQ